jgi:hypothetical protein
MSPSRAACGGAHLPTTTGRRSWEKMGGVSTDGPLPSGEGEHPVADLFQVGLRG